MRPIKIRRRRGLGDIAAGERGKSYGLFLELKTVIAETNGAYRDYLARARANEDERRKTEARDKSKTSVNAFRSEAT
jgi:hypothetical protein